MPLGKTLRQRRIFSRGRALIGTLDTHHSFAGDGLGPAARAFARADLDAIILSPGALQFVAEDLGSLALILRLNLNWPHAPAVASVQSALETGAEAVLLTVDIENPQHLALFGKVSEDARRAGMPLLAEMTGGEYRAMANVAAEFGADMILLRAGINEAPQLRAAIKLVSRPTLAELGILDPPALTRSVQILLDCGSQGIVLSPRPEKLLNALRALVHEGISLDDTLRLLE
jgi:nucleotide-binding universal stress UspA family protein